MGEPAYLGEMMVLLEEGQRLQREKRQLEDKIAQLSKAIQITQSTAVPKKKKDTTKVINTISYYQQQIEIKQRKTDELIQSKEKYMMYLEVEKRRRLEEITSYYDGVMEKTRLAIGQYETERDAWVDTCKSRIESHEASMMEEPNDNPLLLKQEAQMAIHKDELLKLEAKIKENVRENYALQQQCLR